MLYHVQSFSTLFLRSLSLHVLWVSGHFPAPQSRRRRPQWRSSWPGATASTPYIFVQIAPYPAYDIGLTTGIRYAQRAALQLAGVGMVVAADIGDPAGAFHPIHPYSDFEMASISS